MVDQNEHFKNRADVPVQRTYYGIFHYILLCNMRKNRALSIPNPTTYLLAVVEPAEVDPPGQDATENMVVYSRTGPTMVVDVRSIENVVGRVKFKNGDFGIIDRSGGYTRTVFIDDEDV
jgi:hypothetical protein